MFSEETLGCWLIPFILVCGSSYGSHSTNADTGKRVIVEYSSPNIGKDFDGNHFRSTVRGAAIAAAYEAAGWKVHRMNFLGDWGKHIGMLGAGWARFGSEVELESDALNHLQHIFAEVTDLQKAEQADIDEKATPSIEEEKENFFKLLEDGNAEALRLCQMFRDVSVREYVGLYERLNVAFDDFSGESRVTHKSICEVEAALKAAGAYVRSDDADVIEFSRHGNGGLRNNVGRYRNGTTSYLLRDIAAVLDRDRQPGFDQMVYVVAEKQSTHFQQVAAALHLMGRSDLASKIEHVGIGPVKGFISPDGATGSFLRNILDECDTSVDSQISEKLASSSTGVQVEPLVSGRGLGPQTLAVHELSGKRASTMSYSSKQIVDDSGIFVARMYDCLRKVDGIFSIRQDIRGMSGLLDADYSIMETDEHMAMLRHLIQYPAVVKSSWKSLESTTVVLYLQELINLFQDIESVGEKCQEESDLGREARLLLLEAVRVVLTNGMKLLGIWPSQDSTLSGGSDASGVSIADIPMETSE